MYKKFVQLAGSRLVGRQISGIGKCYVIIISLLSAKNIVHILQANGNIKNNR
ncbi:hypothetical protein BACCIP111883_01535 [Sutcliffiella rhizosphaerae]|uniref:Uncharacterized protein n=1 Tax=Sutcliffiella rhizosphaerae TaxID=2880967 RepID=A0ABN8A6P8_9BACI|nr:hypothetical protein BACCIP111883_01535 [Sutcliffiella rhizosphaerae]